ncbi:MAG: hypothetical protein ACKOV8_02290 [Phycisphaerales bacterium]
MALKRTKEPQAPARDERTVAVIRPVPAGFRALAARAAGRGIEVAGTEDFGAGDGRIAAWVDATRAARAVVALPAGSCVVRAVQLPAAAEDRLASALELNANSFVLGRSPRWRVAAALLPADPAAEVRTGVVAEWPEEELAPEVPEAPLDGVARSFAPDVAALAALAAFAEDPLVAVDAGAGAVTACARTSKGMLVRAFRAGGEGEPIGRNDVERAVGEACVHAGVPADETVRLAQRAGDAAEPVLGGGFGATYADVARLSAAVRCAARGADAAAWWREHGIDAGTALAALGPVAALTRLLPDDPGASPDRIGAVLNRLARPSSARTLLVASLATIVLAPPAFEGIRLLLLRWKLPDLAEYRKAEEADAKRQALYRVLSRQSSSMTKTLSDLACATPDGVEVDFINLAQGARGLGISVRGKARPAGNRPGSEVLIDFERQLRETGAFEGIARSSEAPDARGYLDYSVSATAIRPTVMVSLPEELDYAKTSMRERRYGPPPADVDAEASGIAPRDASRAGSGTRTETAGETTGADDAPAAAPAAPAPRSEPAATATAATREPAPPAPPSKSADSTAAARPAAGEDAAPTGRAPRGSSGSTRSGGLATRGNPGAASEPDPLPPPLTSNEIDKMTKQEAQDALAKVAKARQRADIDEDVQQRLRGEFNLLLERCKKP